MRKYYLLTLFEESEGSFNTYVSAYILPNSTQIKERFLWMDQGATLVITFVLQIAGEDFSNCDGIKLIFDEE